MRQSRSRSIEVAFTSGDLFELKGLATLKLVELGLTAVVLTDGAMFQE